MESVVVDSSACSGSHLSYSGVGQLPRKLPRSPRLEGCFGTTYLDTSRECRRKSRVEEILTAVSHSQNLRDRRVAF